MLNIGRKPLYLLILALIQIIGIGFFCKGFFPYKIYLSGYATKEDLPSFDNSMHIEPEFDRLVFVVIDALRNDFIIGNDSGFDFVNNQISQGVAYPFTAKATAPTVTMPRIKALTTGTIPSFLDAILNIAESDTSSSLNFHDNWVYQFKNNGNKTIHFFGDDTWIRLFPELFDKTDGTTSFFVSDTVEVDLNVTRHIETNLAEDDWDAVIFHYLGLDHIGHLGGPKSPLMKPKQKEMDQAIESIYSIVEKQDTKRMISDSKAKGTLIVVCGDHGMNEQGNHGGSSIGETSAALVFLSPRFNSRPTIKQKTPLWDVKQPTVLGYPIIDQIDIVPTLSMLFGFPIPKNNLGKIILSLPGSDNVNYLLHGLGSNAYQLGQLLTRILPEVSKYIEDPISGINNNDSQDSPGRYYSKATLSYEEFLRTGTEKAALEAAQNYYKFIEIAQQYLANTASDYNLSMMVTGVIFMMFSAIGFMFWSFKLANKTHCIWNTSKYFSVFAVLAYSASMFASSFVEEEHKTWYYIVQTTFMLLTVHGLRVPNQTLKERCYLASLSICQLFLVRIAIAWSDKDVSSAILSYLPGFKWNLMGLALLGSVAMKFHRLSKLSGKSDVDVNQMATIFQTVVKGILFLIAVLNCILVIVYKIKSEGATNVPEVFNYFLSWELVQPLDQVRLGRLIFNYWTAGLFVLGGLFYTTKRASLMDIGQVNLGENRTSLFLELLLHLSTPILILLSGSQNAFLFIIFNLQFTLLLLWQSCLSEKSPVPVWLISMIISGLTHGAFFLTGHTNSIASVDLSNAYIGVEEYNTLLIGILTFCSNWSASIWWSIAGWALISNSKKISNIRAASTSKKEEEEEEEIQTEHISQRWVSYLVSQSALFGLVITLLSISVTVLREHLFIWTVFSPKYLYQIAWTVSYHWIIQVVVGSLFTQFFFKWKYTNNDSIDTTDDQVDYQQE